MSTTYTEHYNFGKQENYADLFSMKVITDNWDSLDAILYGFSTGKQDKLSATNKLSVAFVDFTPAQIAALGSGITDDDVEQIDLNKNNISYNTNMGVKNLSPINAASATRRIAIPLALTAGTYTVYIGSISSTDTDDATCQIVAMVGSTVVSDYLKVPRTTGGAYTFNVTGVSDNVYIYASDSYAHSDGDSVTISDFMVCKKAIYDADPAYQPYAMSNAAITAWILAHS